ncbi:NAD(P)-binding domain-containing protein [Terrabacter sp. NPDC000476]|uniref:NADPH-dependent F420 reductase n=1 Tax=Terrabacter sp. NPDC000476 TaxID=3154258 RepID=UPI00332AEBE2
MSTVTILGKGNMGQAIAGIAEKAGHTVELYGSADADRRATGDIVVLAVPHTAVAGLLAERGEQLAGKVVVDITNPLDFATFSLTVPADSSAAAEIAAAVPDARVVKAFNTNFAATLAAGTVGDQPATVLLAGDDAEAKAQVAELVTAGGLRTADVGPLARARELEGLALLQIGLAASEQTSWTTGFALHD